MKKTVLIAGLGLIGGSIAQAIRSAHQVHIIGFDKNLGACDEALKLGIVDEASDSLEKSAMKADLIVLAAPVKGILALIHELSHLELKENVLITDVGSTKRKIMELAKKKLKGKAVFIGGHPMAGSHKSGVGASRPYLFENAYYFIVEDTDRKKAGSPQLMEWLKGTKAKFICFSANEHDRAVGIISHFPHVIASALVNHLKDFSEQGMNLRAYAAGGFRDITRIASSDPTMWRDIVSDNRDVILDLLDRWQQDMSEIRQMLINNDTTAINAFFLDAKHYRDGFPVKQKGAIISDYDLYVDVPDEPYTISKVSGLIGEAGINLTNLNIIEGRENIQGIMRLSFESEQHREKAMTILKKNNYTTYLND
ncbi:prephenate dehydrogenase [Terrilactibacillus sp. BCM23-1]|uniref:Prephenate dehydrogenase n=1 Tax=Terrilactibacillus tamarindi TaxID=2599694 RepID=A0A6N8CNW8_9BACI|nr:prephenate dehydrogenase [Terrilactibacillus tamarindi]MTT31280.1 prephenate dehydrogenase [Terrilactibacillus tamarindi]